MKYLYYKASILRLNPESKKIVKGRGWDCRDSMKNVSNAFEIFYNSIMIGRWILQSFTFFIYFLTVSVKLNYNLKKKGWNFNLLRFSRTYQIIGTEFVMEWIFGRGEHDRLKNQTVDRKKRNNFRKFQIKNS